MERSPAVLRAPASSAVSIPRSSSTQTPCCPSWCSLRYCGRAVRSSNTGVVPDMARIRNEIRRLRFEHGEMTQQELAEKISVTRQTVNAIELGKYSPSLEAAFRIAAVFGKPLETVFHYSDESETGQPKS